MRDIIISNISWTDWILQNKLSQIIVVTPSKEKNLNQSQADNIQTDNIMKSNTLIHCERDKSLNIN